jgi:hypothetical protein
LGAAAFEAWRAEAERVLAAWHGADPSKISRETWWRWYRRGDSAWESAHAYNYIAEAKFDEPCRRR